MSHTEASDASVCDGCVAALGRRAFLRDAAAAAAASVGLAGWATEAAAEDRRPISVIDAIASSTSTVTYAIPAADGVHIDKSKEVILVRWQGVLYAFNLACPHQNTALKWDDAAKRFQCPKHHSRYQPDGAFIDGRATRGMDRFAVSRTAAGVSVDMDTLYQQDRDATSWTSAFVKL